MKQIQASELILNNDGSIYHLHLRPEDISDTIILVGDPDRVETVSSFFDSIELKVNNREFITHTGHFNNKRITVTSTGIGTDNIDIVLNEFDALANIDFNKREVNKTLKSLNFIRIGTSGALQPDIPVGSFIISKTAAGIDGLLNFYANRDDISNPYIEKAFTEHTNWDKSLALPYFVDASERLYNILGKGMTSGITISAPGFYGPQGRVLRLPLSNPSLINKIKDFTFKNQKITNFEMECSAIYGLSKLMNHQAVTICAVIANRTTKEFCQNYKPMIEELIQLILKRVTQATIYGQE